MSGWVMALTVLCAQSAAARKAAQEIVEAFGREAVEQAEMRVARLVEAYGDDAARALRRVGPPGVQTLETFGAAGAKILDRWGDDGLRLLASEGSAAVQALGRFGDDAVAFMIRHPGAGGDLLGRFGAPVARLRLSTESVVNLNRMAGSLGASGRAPEILGVVERFGDRACQFLWRNKGVVFTTAALAAFLADPQPFLDGARHLVVDPLSESAMEATRRTDWTWVTLTAMMLGSLALGLRWAWRSRRDVA